MSPSSPARFVRLPEGRLACDGPEGAVAVNLVSAFPLSEPGAWLSALDSSGREVRFVASLAELEADEQRLVEDELQKVNFLPTVLELRSGVDSDWPQTWRAQTDRGPVVLHLPNEDCLRRLGARGLLIRDASGLEVRVADVTQLDRLTRRLLQAHL